MLGRESEDKNKMPNMDKTGPRGMGPRTGRGTGKCRFRSPNAPFRGEMNYDDLKPIVEEAVRKIMKEKK